MVAFFGFTTEAQRAQRFFQHKDTKGRKGR